jgi:hypothetical protein
MIQQPADISLPSAIISLLLVSFKKLQDLRLVLAGHSFAIVPIDNLQFAMSQPVWGGRDAQQS